jgi:hypothetical protein
LELAATGDDAFQARLEKEAKELTAIGNQFDIRHHETDKIPLRESSHVDYLFHRMWALVYLLLLHTRHSAT